MKNAGQTARHGNASSIACHFMSASEHFLFLRYTNMLIIIMIIIISIIIIIKPHRPYCVPRYGLLLPTE